MKHKLHRIIVLLLTVSFFAAGCSASNQQEGRGEAGADLLNAQWEEIAAEAEGQTVNMYMWGGSETINRYMDEWAAPRLKEQAGITLKRIPINDTKDVINQLLDEKQAGKQAGSIDIIWINGENFKAAKEQEILWGAFAGKLPNVNEYVDQNAPDTNKDFGEETAGLEAPWGKAQFVFTYDESKVKQPPKSMEELKQWVKDNPGKFTYPALPDFTGSAFVRHALYETTGGYEQYLSPLEDQKNIEQTMAPVWDFLNDIEPYLWRKGETYPESLAKLDQLYANGEVWMTMGYDPARASAEVKKGLFPEGTRTFVLDSGTLANTHYLSIPFNSSHKAGAMVVINELLSPDAQIAKLDPVHWGDLMAIDPEKLLEEDQQRAADIDMGAATLPLDVLAKHRLPEMPAAYVDLIEKGWLEHVAKH